MGGLPFNVVPQSQRGLRATFRNKSDSALRRGGRPTNRSLTDPTVARPGWAVGTAVVSREGEKGTSEGCKNYPKPVVSVTLCLSGWLWLTLVVAPAKCEICSRESNRR